jgi:hypothetical protein
VRSGSSIAEDDLKSPVSAARYVNLSPSTLAKLRCAGGGPEYVKFGRAVRYEPAALDRWVASHRVKTTSDAERLPRRLVGGPAEDETPRPSAPISATSANRRGADQSQRRRRNSSDEVAG